jgi:REP element-mobilizing transposase RayT
LPQPTPVWHSRGYLPHWEAGEVPQSITFRLADSLPTVLLSRWREELYALPIERSTFERRLRIQMALDQGHGDGALSHPDIANAIEQALLFFDSERYRLHAWCIMPNHVHVAATPLGTWSLSAILHSWKSYSAKRANLVRQRGGALWAPEYFDRAIRDQAHYENALDYIAMNPVNAGLCRAPEDWRFSSAWHHQKERAGGTPAFPAE